MKGRVEVEEEEVEEEGEDLQDCIDEARVTEVHQADAVSCIEQPQVNVMDDLLKR